MDAQLWSRRVSESVDPGCSCHGHNARTLCAEQERLEAASDPNDYVNQKLADVYERLNRHSGAHNTRVLLDGMATPRAFRRQASMVPHKTANLRDHTISSG